MDATSLPTESQGVCFVDSSTILHVIMCSWILDPLSMNEVPCQGTFQERPWGDAPRLRPDIFSPGPNTKFTRWNNDATDMMPSLVLHPTRRMKGTTAWVLVMRRFLYHDS